MTDHPVLPFQRRVATRIAAVSLGLAAIASPLAWYTERERSEATIVALAREESQRIIGQHHAIDLGTEHAQDHALEAARAISGGLFDIAEIYDRAGRKLAESMTRAGHEVEKALPSHGAPQYTEASYESLTLPGKVWVLRIFVPLYGQGRPGPVTGYFEGVRVVPPWQADQLSHNAALVALMVALSALLCGLALYPVVLRLARTNERQSQALVATQAALIEGLKQSELQLEAKVQQRTAELEQAQGRTRELLHNILPAGVARELSEQGRVRATRHDAVTILFTDFGGFTQAAAAMPADRMVAELNEIFAAFDDICDALGVEKIKTIGDAYMAAAGLPQPCADHALRCVQAGLHMIDYLDRRNQSATFKWALRVGVHSGPVVAGVVGKRKYAYDVWGDTVNIASRMESAGVPGRVNLSAYTYDLVRGVLDCEYRGKLDAKGKGAIDMYLVTPVQRAAAVS